MVTVNDLGNPNDPLTGNLYGGVNYTYQIGKYEVTLAQYTAFLNAVAASDPNWLYNENMGSDVNILGIARSGSDGSYTYSVIGDGQRPVTYVSWFDAARFANWMHNGQPVGSQTAGTTEDGAYTLNGASGGVGFTKNVGAEYWIPSESEWYKAAYYQPVGAGGDVDGYWAFPMRTNSQPYSDQPPGTTPDNTRVGNFNLDDGFVNGYNDGYAVSGSTSFPTGNGLTAVGAYSASACYYGTYDQGGNVHEWNDAVIGESRGLRGGSWNIGVDILPSYSRNWNGAILEDPGIGFRLARAQICVPPPSGMVGWWTGDGNTGDMIGGNNGTLQGGATFAAGAVSQGFSLNGSTAHVLIGNPDSLKLNSLTIDAWVNPTSNPGHGIAVATKWNQNSSSGSDGDAYGLWLANNNGTLEVYAAVHPPNVNPQIGQQGGTVPLNTFTHVAMTYDATSSTLSVYLNGVQVTSYSRNEPNNLVQSDVNVDIGRENQNINYFPGIIDEVEIFNRALDTSEIAAIYNAGSAGKCKPSPSPTPATTPTPTPTATPTPTPTPINISGTVSYCSNPVPGPVPNVTLTLTGSRRAQPCPTAPVTTRFHLFPRRELYRDADQGRPGAGRRGHQHRGCDRRAKAFPQFGLSSQGCRLTAADVNGDSRDQYR